VLAGTRRVRRRVAGHDRRAVKLGEYFAFWTRDRDEQVTARLRELAAHGAGGEAAAEVYREALHDYGEEARRVRREHRALHTAEGRLDARLRRRRGTSLPRLVLPEDCLVVLDGWRERAEAGAERPSLDTRLVTGLVTARRAA
jgi:hypothetical protein